MASLHELTPIYLFRYTLARRQSFSGIRLLILRLTLVILQESAYNCQLRAFTFFSRQARTHLLILVQYLN